MRPSSFAPAPRPALPWALACALAALAAGCFVSPGGPPGGPVDPGLGPVCPAGAPHLAIALRGYSTGAGSQLIRFDADMSPCRGVEFPSDYGQAYTVAGLSDGSEVVGFFRSGRAPIFARVQGNTVLWALESEDSQVDVIDAAPVTYEGQPRIAILLRYSGRGAVNIVDYEGNAPVAFEPPESYYGLAGSGAGLIGMEQWDGVRFMSLSSAGLGLAGQRAVAAPRSGELKSVRLRQGVLTVGAARGLLYHRGSGPEAFLGPLSCLHAADSWTVFPEDGDDTLGGVPALDGSGDFFVATGDGTGGGLYRMSEIGECSLIGTANDASHGITAIDWAGPVGP